MRYEFIIKHLLSLSPRRTGTGVSGTGVLSPDKAPGGVAHRVFIAP